MKSLDNVKIFQLWGGYYTKITRNGRERKFVGVSQYSINRLNRWMQANGFYKAY